MDSESYGHPYPNHNQAETSNENLVHERRSSVVEACIDYYGDDYKFSTQEDIKPTSSYSTPSITQQAHTNSLDATERMQFLREMEQAREELAEFRRNMAGLVQQMDGIAVDLEKSKDRVFEIEQDLTATEEVNVNLQVLLERAVKTQKESDVFATQAIRNMYSDLASVVYENNQLQSRLVSIENHQREQKGSVHDIVKRMFEYTQMLEQAQGTIHMLQEPRLVKSTTSSSTTTSTSRRNSVLSFYNTEDDDDHSFVSQTNKRPYVQSPPLGPQSTTTAILKPQQGLRMLFDSHAGNQLGLSTLATTTKK
ncbi:uncharacterized protein EV154DRAFT_509189 [Mucor mucedo]|uniref:uncharacterized protein n=1 Tax=Mucor mucedo TaxID=29922 RepID=UPI00221F9496|nr:uncharacterized protein EV154DRAFT_509189 [Mucor mucedo]KAI7891105.1 hypothetical protein EV154DRAFT_509189 [Mucor mucedo]